MKISIVWDGDTVEAHPFNSPGVVSRADEEPAQRPTWTPDQLERLDMVAGLLLGECVCEPDYGNGLRYRRVVGDLRIIVRPELVGGAP